ncbi:MAG: MerR family transcriptional regulator [Usitatibacter sp.]
MPIRTLSALTGVNPITLRAWERRYGLLQPRRTATGHRMYTAAHVELIRRVVALRERGVPIGRMREALGTSAAASRDAPGPWTAAIDRMAAAIARFDEAELDLIYDEVLAVHPVEEFTHRLMLPLLARLGERWAKVPGAIAEEHFFATYVRSKLGARLLQRTRHTDGPRIVAACGPGEHHEIGLLLFALEARLAGLRPIVLGADTPFEEIAIAARRSACEGVVVSHSIDPAPGTLERRLAALVRESRVPVFVGGASSTRHRPAICAAGAIPLGAEIEQGVRLILTRLAPKGKAP